MTPLQLAHQFCANCHSGSECAGLDIGADGSLFRFRSVGTCNVNTSRCSYWEIGVAPMVRMLPAGHLRESILTAVAIYLRQFRDNLPAKLAAKRNIYGEAPDDPLKPGKPCTDCGSVIPQRRLVCAKCGAVRQREAKRRSKAIINGKTPLAPQPLRDAKQGKPYQGSGHPQNRNQNAS